MHWYMWFIPQYLFLVFLIFSVMQCIVSDDDAVVAFMMTTMMSTTYNTEKNNIYTENSEHKINTVWHIM